jgi:phage protein U
MTMLSLGQFAFGLDTLAHQELDRSSAWRHASNSRVGARPARQFVGAGDDSITLTGLLAPEFKGSAQSLDQLRQMAGDGNAYALVDGTGQVFGAWVIESVQEKSSIFIAEGLPRRIEFTLQLQRVDDERASADGGLDIDDGLWDGWLWWF